MKKEMRFISGTRVLVSMSAAILISWLGTVSVFAHAQLLKSNPPDKAELAQPPARVEFWFNELLEDGFNSVEVIPAGELSNKNHTNLAEGSPKIDPADKTHLTVGLKALHPGKYVIQYRVLSRDGHTAPGQLTFEVKDRG